jgi:fatty acid CoA ligase FadD9
MMTRTKSDNDSGGEREAAPKERLTHRIADPSANDTQFRDGRPMEAITAAIQQPGMRLSQIVATVMEGYADRPALGQRTHELTTDAVTGRTSVRSLPRFKTISYRQLWGRVGAVAAAWHNDPAHPLGAGDFVCTMGFTSTDYTTLDLACVYLGAVSVPLQISATVSQLMPIIAETAPRILATSIDFLDDAVESVLAGFAPQRLLVLDYLPPDDEHKDKFEAARRRLAQARRAVVVDSLSAVLGRGRRLPPAPMFVADPDEDPLAMVTYTSGHTGTPKSATYTERVIARNWRNPPRLPRTSINYAPMSHALGRAMVAITLASGGTGYFCGQE